MTPQFLIACGAYAAIMLVPGYLLLRALSVPRCWSVCLASLPSVGMLCVMGQLYATLGISANPVLMLGPICIVPAIVAVLRRDAEPLQMPKLDWWIPLIYVALGFVLSNSFFLSRLVTNDTVIQSFDLTQAIQLIRSFANAGRFSSLGLDYYLEDPSVNPFPGATFYPASWHMICALAVQMTGATAAMIINVSQFVSMSVVFPLGMCATMASIFDGDRQRTLCGALTCHAFVIFPWVFLIFGPIYPNMAAFSALPGIIALFVNLTAHDHTLHERIVLGVGFLVGGIGLGLLHPNAIFAAAVILIPYCVQRVFVEVNAISTHRLVPIAASAATALACMVIWYVCFKLPMFQSIVLESWGTFAQEWQEIVNIALVSYMYGNWYEFAAQIPLAIAIAIGIACVLHKREYLWLAFSYGFACFIMLVCATQENYIKHLLAGFWYCDHIRVAGLCCIAAMPLTALGLSWCYDQALRVVRLYNGSERQTNVRKVAAICACLFLVINYLPEFDMPGSYFQVTLNEGKNDDVPIEDFLTYPESRRRLAGRKYHSVHTPFGDVRNAITRKTVSESPVNTRERRFLEHVSQVVGSDELVINNPMDGSFLGYGFYNIRCYYRSFVHGGFEEMPESKLIRTKLANIATDPEVRAAVDKIGAHYVLNITEHKAEESYINLRGYYSTTAYAGISSITPDTPGFELVMQEYELKLYRILPEQG